MWNVWPYGISCAFQSLYGTSCVGRVTLTLFLGLSVCFIILSISVEGLFYCSYAATLAIWADAEAMLRDYTKTTKARTQGTTLQLDDLRIAIFFLLFVQVAFFGTGK